MINFKADLKAAALVVFIMALFSLASVLIGFGCFYFARFLFSLYGGI